MLDVVLAHAIGCSCPLLHEHLADITAGLKFVCCGACSLYHMAYTAQQSLHYAKSACSVSCLVRQAQLVSET